MAEFYGQAMSDVPFYVVHTIKDESARITRSGALKLLEAEVVLLEDPDAGRGYRKCIKGRTRLEAIVATGEAVERRVLHVRVDSTTDDVERMIAAVQVLTEKNPTGRPPYVLPVDEE